MWWRGLRKILNCCQSKFYLYNIVLIIYKGKPNVKRQALIDKAFLKFDRDGSGYISAADLRGVYNCSFHPKVQQGHMTEEQVFYEFLQTFSDVNKDGTIMREVNNRSNIIRNGTIITHPFVQVSIMMIILYNL